MSARALKKAKSPATRNRFNDIGVTGRKTGVRVAGSVRVDEDGLENVDEFYKQTSPPDNALKPAKPKPSTRSLHTLLSPTPIRSTPNYDSLIGALEIPNVDHSHIEEDISGAAAAREDEATVTPAQARAMRAHIATKSSIEDLRDSSPTSKVSARSAARRTTIAPSQMAEIDKEWVRSPKRSRRVTMGFAAQRLKAELEEEAAAAAGAAAADAAVVEETTIEEFDHRTEDPGELTSATVIEGDDAPDDMHNASEDDAPARIIEDSIEEEEDEENDSRFDNADDAANTPEDAVDLNGHHAAASAAESSAEESDNPDSQNEDVSEQASLSKSPQSKPKGASKRANKKHKAEQPIRRSTRASVQPLAFWRNEHIEYEYEPGASNGIPVPKMKNIVRVRQTKEEKNNAKKRRVKRTTHLPSLRGIKPSELDLNDRNRFYYYDDENYGFPVKDDSSCSFGPKYVSPRKPSKSSKRSIEQFNDDDDIDVASEPLLVLDSDGETEQQREVVLSRQDIEWTNINKNDDEYRVGLGLYTEQPDGSINASSGTLSIAVGGKKPARNSADKTLFYLVTSGQVEVSVHSSTFRVGILGQFLVPKYNSYSITNVGTHPAQLYYVHLCTSAPSNDRGDKTEDSSDSE
ncbi:mitotic fidelity of chromosome transmission- protein [Coemansia guatemalensis]|uniref:Mitotic fidelity of chromosome transmission-protein n=1 Tax=Coemansia guatemalensis TaxID=2761395 RepID=A0A9W8LUK6_9FUNG|nr:mitotic fidelity of chromosome transmission- protein [Coemansia guatemalensis]